MMDAVSPIYAIGVDGGGTKTLAVIVDTQGNECGRGIAGSANHKGVGVTKAIGNIRSAIEAAASQAACSLPLQSAWFGLAGIDRPQDHDLLLPHLRPLAHHMRLTNDADLVLSGLPGAIGIALIAGTGSIALGRDLQGSSVRAGGWGYLIGDEGSGYDLGLRCLQAVAQAADGRGKATILVDLVLQQWHLDTASDIIGNIYKDCDRATIAALSTLVCAAARDGDRVAYDIVEHAAHELAKALVAVKTRLTFPHDQVPLALGGGLLLHEASFRAQVIAAIGEHVSIGSVVLVGEPALSAARAGLFVPHAPNSGVGVP